jgi:hemerythrin-like metal-binding protein
MLSEELLTGIEQIDRDHQAILEQIEIFVNSEDSHTVRMNLIEKLVEYFTTHCMMEEKLMVDHGYERRAYLDHIEAHTALKGLLKGRIVEVLREFDKDRITQEFTQSIKNHIVTYDMQLATFLKSL